MHARSPTRLGQVVAYRLAIDVAWVGGWHGYRLRIGASDQYRPGIGSGRGAKYQRQCGDGPDGNAGLVAPRRPNGPEQALQGFSCRTDPTRGISARTMY